jgi:hypothetical protein
MTGRPGNVCYAATPTNRSAREINMEVLVQLFTGIAVFFMSIGVMLIGVAALKWVQILERKEGQ